MLILSSNQASQDKSPPLASGMNKFHKLFCIFMVLISILVLISLSSFLLLSSISNSPDSLSRKLGISSLLKPITSFLVPPQDEILKPFLDENEYRSITLPNGLKVLMISDLKAYRGSLALAVEAGSWADPPEIPGISHLLANCLANLSSLFKRDEKGVYDYERFQVGNTVTSYASDVNLKDFEKSLEIFVDPFINPRFDTEFDKNPDSDSLSYSWPNNQYTDDFKFFEAFKHIVDPNSVFANHSNFRDIHTLYTNLKEQGVDIPKAMEDYFKKYYSANVMSLVVLHNKPLDEIERIITQSSFGKILNKNLPKSSFLNKFSKPLTDKNRHKVIGYETNSYYNQKGFLAFQVCGGISSKMDSVQFILDILSTDYSDSSFLNLLISRGWISKMKTDYIPFSSDCGIIRIELSMTKHGIENSGNIVARILTTIKHFALKEIKFLSKDQYKNYFHQKYALFEYQDAPIIHYKDEIETLAKNLLHRSPRNILSQLDPYFDLYEKSTEIQSILLQMNTDNLLVLAENFANNGQFKLEHEYKNQYSVEDIPKEQIIQWNNYFSNDLFKATLSVQEFHLLQKVNLIDQSQFSHENKSLIQIDNNQNLTILYQPETSLKTIKTALYLRFPAIKTIEDKLFVKMTHDYFLMQNHVQNSKKAFQAGGSSFNIYDDYIQIKALNGNLDEVSNWVAESYLYKDLSENNGPHSSFSQSFTSQLKQLESYSLRAYPYSPKQEGFMFLDEILINHRCTSFPEIKKNMMKKLSSYSSNLKKIAEDRQAMFSNPEVFASGNILPEDVLSIVQKIHSKTPTFESKTSDKDLLEIGRRNLLYRTHFKNIWETQKKPYILNYYQGGPATAKNIAYMHVLVDFLLDKVYDSQTDGNYSMTRNYFVEVNEYFKGNTVGFAVSLESYASLPNDIDVYVEDLLQNFRSNPYSKTYNHPEVIEYLFGERAQTMWLDFSSFESKTDALYQSIKDKIPSSVRREDIIDAFRDLTMEKFQNYVNEFFETCGKLSIRGFANNQDFSADPLPDVKTQLIVPITPKLIRTSEDLHNLSSI